MQLWLRLNANISYMQFTVKRRPTNNDKNELCYCMHVAALNPLKPHSNSPLYRNTVIDTLAVDGWAVTFGTARTEEVPSSLYQMYQPTHQRPVYQLHIIRCGIITAFALWTVNAVIDNAAAARRALNWMITSSLRFALSTRRHLPSRAYTKHQHHQHAAATW